MYYYWSLLKPSVTNQRLVSGANIMVLREGYNKQDDRNKHTPLIVQPTYRESDNTAVTPALNVLPGVWKRSECLIPWIFKGCTHTHTIKSRKSNIRTHWLLSKVFLCASRGKTKKKKQTKKKSELSLYHREIIPAATVELVLSGGD